MLMLGTAKQEITPEHPVRLVGYATRTTPFEKVAEPIFVRVHWYRQEKAQALILYGDLLWWNSEFVAMARPRLAQALGVEQNCILFTASHNHSGPGTGSSFTGLLETADAAYVEELYQKVEQTARKAMAAEGPVVGTVYRGQCAMNVYRRVLTEQGVAMRPNYQQPADHTLTLVRLSRPDGTVAATVVHYPCHANLANGNVVHPDYPGAALRRLDEDAPGSVSLFLQGCTADLRPNSVLGETFVPQDYEGVQKFAQQFYECCHQLLEQPGEPLGEGLLLKQCSVELPLDQSGLQQALKLADQGEEADRQWKEKVLEKDCRPHEILELTLLRLGALPVFFMNAEVAQYYAAFAREQLPGALVTGYSNGMIGYLATAQQIRHGGYEPEGSAVYFALAGTYSERIEELICKGLKTLAQQA